MDELQPFEDLPPDDLPGAGADLVDLLPYDDDFHLDVGLLGGTSPFELPAAAELGLPEPADPITDLVYVEEESFEQVARDLWEQVGPGGPLPTAPDGSPTTPPAIFAELQNQTDDPVILSMLANGIEQWGRAQETWRS